jgi:hypothetical protein
MYNRYVYTKSNAIICHILYNGLICHLMSEHGPYLAKFGKLLTGVIPPLDL